MPMKPSYVFSVGEDRAIRSKSYVPLRVLRALVASKATVIGVMDNRKDGLFSARIQVQHDKVLDFLRYLHGVAVFVEERQP